MGVASASTTMAVAMASASDCVVTILLAAETPTSLITLNMDCVTCQNVDFSHNEQDWYPDINEDEELCMAGKRVGV